MRLTFIRTVVFDVSQISKRYSYIKGSNNSVLPLSNCRTKKRWLFTHDILQSLFWFFSLFFFTFESTMRFIQSAIFVCIIAFSFQNGSCGFIGDAFQQGIHTAFGFIKDIPNRIPTPNEVFEFGKNILIGLPMELTINVIHEFCKCPLHNFIIDQMRIMECL